MGETASAVELVVNRSRDFGRTWLATEKLIAAPETTDMYLASAPGGKAYVAYDMGADIRLARSSTYFDSFTDADVDQNNLPDDKLPKLCTQGNQVVLVWQDANVAGNAWSVWGTVSNDAGATWSPRLQLRPEGTPGAADYLDLACDGANAAVAAWSDSRLQGIKVYANRYNGSTLAGDVNVSEVPDGYKRLVKKIVAELRPLTAKYPGAEVRYSTEDPMSGMLFSGGKPSSSRTVRSFRRMMDWGVSPNR